jgi:hypothetical protein
VATVVEESGLPPPLVIEVEESGVPPLPVTAAAVEDGRAAVEAAAPQAVLEPPTGAGSGGADVVMVPSDKDMTPPPPAGDCDIVMSTVPEASPVVGAASVEEAMDMAACRYMVLPGIGTIDLNTHEPPSNDRELLEAFTERMFAEPTILETIVSVASALRQYESADGSAPPSCRRRQREFSRNPRPAQSQPRLRLCLRRLERTSARPCPSLQKQYYPRLLLRWRRDEEYCRRGRALVAPSGRRRHGRGSHAGRARRGPSRSRWPRGCDKGCLPRDPGGRGGHGRSLVAGRRERRGLDARARPHLVGGCLRVRRRCRGRRGSRGAQHLGGQVGVGTPRIR